MSIWKLLLLFIASVVLIALALPLYHINGDVSPTVRATIKNDLKQLAISIHNYHDISFSLPQVTFKNETDEPVHSWMTMLLPHIEQGPLFDRIDLSKSWDDRSQAELFRRRIEAYMSYAIDRKKIDPTEPAPSHYAGNIHVILEGEPIGFDDVSDGTGMTIMMGEAFGNFEPWGKPGNVRDPIGGINQSMTGFGSKLGAKAKWYESQGSPGCRFLFVDGRVKFIAEDIDPDVLRRLALPNDGEDVGEF